jgi:hypothetical protein
MIITDFSYGENNKKLSDFGFIVCRFDSGGLDTVSNGAVVEFNTVSVQNGAKQELTNSSYGDCLETVIQVCKNPCVNGNTEIDQTTFRELTRWLCRRKFLRFKPITNEYLDLYHEATISVSRIEIDGKLVGLELEIKTNRPFALKEPRIINISNTETNGKHSINDTSHEEGYIYPKMEITINQNGDLNIHNAIENRNTYIKNCVQGEVITMDYPVITSSLSSHNIQNDFNWQFFRVANTFDNSRNDLTISLSCSIKIEYSPIVKVGL